MKRFYTSNSGMNKGTLYQLRCLINRRNVSGRVKEEMNQIQDFLRSVMKVHVLCEFFGNKTQVLAANLSQMDFNFIIQWWKMEVLEWKAWHNSRSVCDALFVVRACTPQRVKREQRDRWSQRLRNGFADWHSYGRGAVKEGDGDRLVRFWRFMQLYCSATGHLKYAFECFNFVAQISSTLTAQEAYRTKWCWFANTKGTAAHNLSGDLLMEHWNKSMKTHLCGVGANQDWASHTDLLLCQAFHSRTSIFHHWMIKLKSICDRLAARTCVLFPKNSQSTWTFMTDRRKSWIWFISSFTRPETFLLLMRHLNWYSVPLFMPELEV